MKTEESFDLNEFKSKEKKMAREYTLKPEVNPDKLNSFTISVKENDNTI